LNDEQNDRRKRSRENDLDGHRSDNFDDHRRDDLDGNSPLDNVQVLAQRDLVRGPDLFQNAEIFYALGDRYEIAKVIGRKKDNEGNYIGRMHKNPIIDSRICTIHFQDGEERDITFNLLSEHLYSQVDSEGPQYRIFKEIINHRKNKNVLDKEDGYRTLANGTWVPKKSVVGCDLKVEWKDGTTACIPLKELKEKIL
jgi:hypothetical protein